MHECHITIKEPCERADTIRQLVEDTVWHFSMIDGDPKLGPGVKMYATANFDGSEEQATRNIEWKRDVLIACKCNVVRCKIEKIVYDEPVVIADPQQ